ncbi:MAG: sigma-70 family RNA polymerase sigma factor [Acidipila sp.]|nr:sigma-70 family RNA polymerase sigma factor [Acidipila sp.]
MAVWKELDADSKLLAWSNTRLVKECINRNEEAWSALIDKYKSLIFSIPIKYGFSVDDASDIFQSVCLELLAELPNLRKAEALPKWIMQVTAHKCFRGRRQQQRTESVDPGDTRIDRATPARAEAILREAEEEQNLQQALAELPPRCRQLVHLLFYEDPPREYRKVAEELGIAVGSIGFIRQRCLDKLRQRLTEVGF